MPSLEQKEEELFGQWRASWSDSFVTDGAVDPNAYVASSPRILFLLKEANDPDGGGWCLREFLRRGGRPQTWNNITRWVQAIRRLPDEVPWDDLRCVAESNRREMLQAIAVVNLKKLPGGHTTERKDFWEVVQRDAHWIRDQVALYDADLIVCCGTDLGSAFKVFIEPNRNPWRVTSRGVEFLEYAPRKFVLIYLHPEARVSDNILHYGLIDAVRELLFGKHAD